MTGRPFQSPGAGQKAPCSSIGADDSSLSQRGGIEDLRDLIGESARIDGLGDIAVAARDRRSLIVALHGKSGERNHRNVREARIGLQETRQAEAIDSGQRDVDYDEVRHQVRQGALRLLRIGHAFGPEAADLEQFPDQLQVDRIVVDDENMSAQLQDRGNTFHAASLYARHVGKTLKRQGNFREKSDAGRIFI